MNHQTNRNNCACAGETRSGTCPYGRTPWGTREAGNCNRRPWNSRGTCSCGQAGRIGADPCTANTTWKNRGEGCSCGTPRTETCPCAQTPRTETRSCTEARRDGDCDDTCNHGAKNNGVLDGHSLAMVYSPYQNFESLYDPRQGLCNGTIFSGLNKPFYGDRRGF